MTDGCVRHLDAVPCCVQNCHLAQSWMPQLVKLVEEVEAAAAAAAPGAAAATAAAVTPASGVATAPKPSAASAATNAAQGFFLETALQPEQQQQQLPALHPNFRLWLNSSPVDFFPPVLLHKGVRLFLEPHRGLKPTLLGIYASLPRGYLAACDGCGRGPQWRQLVFAGALLHGLLCERRRFGPLGWNVPYEFSEGDLSCALANIQVRHSTGLVIMYRGFGTYTCVGQHRPYAEPGSWHAGTSSRTHRSLKLEPVGVAGGLLHV